MLRISSGSIKNVGKQRKVIKRYHDCKLDQFSAESRVYYASVKSLFKNLVKCKKWSYEKQITDMLTEARNSSDFWAVVKPSRFKSSTVNIVSLENWYDYLVESFP